MFTQFVCPGLPVSGSPRDVSVTVAATDSGKVRITLEGASVDLPEWAVNKLIEAIEGNRPRSETMAAEDERFTEKLNKLLPVGSEIGRKFDEQIGEWFSVHYFANDRAYSAYKPTALEAFEAIETELKPQAEAYRKELAAAS